MSTAAHTRSRAEWAPKDGPEAAAIHARDLYIDLADALPQGRATLGHYARRVALMAKGDIWPNAADWDRLAAAGQRDAVVAYYESEAERMKGHPVSDTEAHLATLVREHGEAVGASLEAQSDPSRLPVAINEGFDLYRAAGHHVRTLMRQKHERIVSRNMAMQRLSVRPNGAA